MRNRKDHLCTLLTFALLIGAASCNQATAIPTATIAPIATTTPPPTETPAPTLQPGDSEHKLTVNGLERTYVLHIPPGLDHLHLAPVVLAFHGLGENPATMELMTGFSDIADQANFLLVYPEGVGNSWNAGGTCCGYANTHEVDEKPFIQQILSDLVTIASIDTKRIYATGFSNGAVLVYRLACEMSDTFAAIAPVAGILAYNPCQQQEPVSLIHVHGLNDTFFPYLGGGEWDTPPVEQVITAWVQSDNCTGSAQVEKQKNIITHTIYTSCQTDTAVELYTIELGGHAWSSKYVWPASQVIWDFFATHPKP